MDQIVGALSADLVDLADACKVYLAETNTSVSSPTSKQDIEEVEVLVKRFIGALNILGNGEGNGEWKTENRLVGT